MTELKEAFAQLKSILCLNGEIPDKSFFQQHAGLTLIAADGAGSALIKQGIIPNIIVGDLDSLDKSVVPSSIEIINKTDVVTTDFEKALTVVIAKNLFPCLVCGATGKETDHTIYNLHVFAKNALKYQLMLHDSAFKAKNKYGLMITEQFTAKLNIGANISFFAFIPTDISTKGLKWELEHWQLSPLESNHRNATAEEDITITVHHGELLVLFDF